MSESRAIKPQHALSERARDQHITETGIRIVGRAIPLFTSNEGASLRASSDVSETLYIARFRLRPRMRKDRVVPIVLTTLNEAILQSWPEAPQLPMDEAIARKPERYHGLTWVPERDLGRWTGELIWRHPHPVVKGVACTTQVIISEIEDQVRLAVRVSVAGGLPSVRGYVGGGQARPSFLAALRGRVRVLTEDSDTQPRFLTEADIEGFVQDVLLSESRSQPVALLSPTTEGGYLVEPEELASELLGLAPLYVIEGHPTTFRLTDLLGDRRLSCFFGALRAYMPMFSCADSPLEHPLLLHERLVDPVQRTELIGRLGQVAAQAVGMPRGTIADATEEGPEHEAPEPALSSPAAPAKHHATTVVTKPTPTSAPAVGTVAATGSVEAAAASNALLAAILPTLAALDSRIADLASAIRAQNETNASIAEEIGRLRISSALRQSNTSGIERRLDRIDSLLMAIPAGGQVAPPDASEEDGAQDDDDDDSLALVDIVRLAGSTHEDALLILDGAERSAGESNYRDLDRVAAVLDAMADISSRRQAGTLQKSLREAFRELGIEYRTTISKSTPPKLRQQYIVHGGGGTFYECLEHIALGSSYDPERCLRIYFTSRDPSEPRFVIGHVGRHFTVATTT